MIALILSVRHGGLLLGHWTNDMELTGSIPAFSLSQSDPRQVIHTHVPLFSKQYKLLLAKSGNAVKVGRLQVWQKVMVAYCSVYDYCQLWPRKLEISTSLSGIELLMYLTFP